MFTGLGKLKNHAVKLNIDKEAIPQAQPQRRIPFHIRKKVKHAVKELQKEDIIEAVPETQPTPWVSPIVAVPKKDDTTRICVDMRMANQAINRVRYPIPGGVTSICRWISCEFPKSLRKGIIEPSILGHRFLKIGLFFHGKSENSKIRVTIYDDEYRTF